MWEGSHGSSKTDQLVAQTRSMKGITRLVTHFGMKLKMQVNSEHNPFKVRWVRYKEQCSCSLASTLITKKPTSTPRCLQASYALNTMLHAQIKLNRARHSTTLKPYMIHTSVASHVTCCLHVAGPCIAAFISNDTHTRTYVHT